MAIAALILGIVATILGIIPCTYFMGFLCGIPGLILGLISMKKARAAGAKTTLGLVGTILSGVGMGIGTLWIIIGLALS